MAFLTVQTPFIRFMSKLRRASQKIAGLLDPRHPAVVLSLILLPAAAAVMLIGVSAAEEHNDFCIICHTAPEEAYYHRAQIVNPLTTESILDLASAHVAKRGAFQCIDCHRGDQGLTDRGRTVLLGAQDALIFVSGRADPRLEKVTASQPDLLNRACVQCHAESLLAGGFNNHFHNRLQAAHSVQLAAGTPEADSHAAESTVSCTDCHRAHVQLDHGADRMFLDVEGTVYPACARCHLELGQGPLDLNP